MLLEDIESLLEDVLWNYELVNPLVLRAALGSNRFYECPPPHGRRPHAKHRRDTPPHTHCQKGTGRGCRFPETTRGRGLF